MSTLLYSPGVRIYVETEQHGVIDVSDDVTDGTMVRRSDGVSSFNFSLQNARRKYDGLFAPNDRIVVMLRRITWMRVFTGYLNSVPLLTAWPRVVPLAASCSLKRLQYWYWDAGLPASQNLVTAALGAVKTDTDGGIANVALTLLKDVVGWPAEKVHIGGIPKDWFNLAYQIAKDIDARAEEADEIARQFYSALQGGGIVAGAPTAGGPIPKGSMKTGNYGGEGITAPMLPYVEQIYNTGKTVGATDRDIVIGMMTAMQESSMGANTKAMKTENQFGCIGLFQQTIKGYRPGWGPNEGWGTKAELLDPARQCQNFYSRLLKIANRASMTTAQAAEKVQVSGEGFRFAKHEQMGVQVVAYLNSIANGTAPDAQNPGSQNQNPGTWGQGRSTGQALADLGVRLVTQNPNISYQLGGDDPPDTPLLKVTKLDCCLTGDALVSTVRGPVPIAEIEQGDQVYAWENGRMVVRDVLGRLDQPVQDVLKVRTRNRTVRASENHPFLRLSAPLSPSHSPGDTKPEWTTSWARADEMRVGDLIVTLDSGDGEDDQGLRAMGAYRVLKDDRFRIERVLGVDPDGEELTYDIEVDGAKNFIANGVVVHNSSFVQWVYYQLLGSLGGLPRTTQTQIAWLRKHGKRITAEEGVMTAGALLYHPGHVEMSLGTGTHVVGAHNSADDVNVKKWASKEALKAYLPQAYLLPDLQYSVGSGGTFIPGTGAGGGSEGAGEGGATQVPIQQGSDQPGYNPNDDYDKLFGNNPWVPQINEQESAYSSSLTGIRALLNDQPFLPYLKNLFNTTMRSFSSAPNGDLIAWFPDYYGIWGTAASMIIEPIEIRDFNVEWSDDYFVTHQYTTAAAAFNFLDPSSGVGTPQMANLAEVFTMGIATIDVPSILFSLFGIEADKDTATKFINYVYKRFGARPDFQQLPGVVGTKGEFFSALFLFMRQWAYQYNADIPLTFMPELWPGMLIKIPEFDFQAYVTTVTHSFSFGESGGFSTTVNIAAPARLPKPGGDKSNTLIGLPIAGGLLPNKSKAK